MKRFFPLLSAVCTFICFSQLSHAQWVRQYPLEKLEDVLDIDVSTDGYGFAVGSNDLLLRLDAATKTWELLPGYGQNWRFEAVDYLDGSGGNVAAVGGNGLLLTTNHGDTWTKIDGAPAGVHTIKMFSEDHLIAIGDDDAFVWKDNQWTDLHVLAPASIRGAVVLDEMHMWLYTSNTNQVIIYTTDGGMQWNFNTDIADIDVVRFYDELNGIATDARDIYTTSNGGINWTLTGNNALPNTLNDLTYGSSRHILVGATINAEPTFSADSGKTWTSVDPGLLNQRSFSVAAVSDTEFWMGNDLSSITYSTDGGFTWEERSGPDRNIINDVFFINRSVGFAIGQKGMLLSTRNGGTDWEDISFGTRSHLALHGLTENSLWMGANQRILHSIDTGTTWTEALVVVGGNINDILALSSQRIVAGSSSGVIYLSTNGGTDWDTVYDAGAQIRSIAKIDDQRLMATGFNGVIIRSEDLGATWHPVSVPEAGLQYEQAYFLDTCGWLVTSSFKKTMWKTTNAGDSWTPLTLPVDRFWDGVYFITPDTGVVVARTSNEGRAYITFTGGQTWSSGHILSFPLFGVAGVPNPNGTAWIFGYGSDIEVLPYCNTFPSIANFTGNLFPCENDTVTYSVTSENVDQFNWFFPSDWHIISDPNNDTVAVAVGSNSGFINISGSNACGETGQLNFSAGPTLLPELFTVQGDPFPCAASIVEYTVFENNTTDFSWSLPADWAVIGNENQATVMIQVGFIEGVISVSGANSCGTATAPDFFVTPEPPPVASLMSGDLTPCPGDTVTYVFNPGFDSYSISNVQGLGDWTFLNSPLYSIAGHESGSFQVAVTNLCGTSAPYTVVISPENVPDIDIFFNEGTSTFTASQTGNQYQWYFNGAPISGATNPTYIATQNGTYFVEITFANGCTGASDPLTVTTVATVNVESASLKIYPVPAQDKIYFDGLTGPFSYQIIDLAGRIIITGQQEESMIHIAELDKGYYLLNVLRDDKTYISGFVKQ